MQRHGQHEIEEREDLLPADGRGLLLGVVSVVGIWGRLVIRRKGYGSERGVSVLLLSDRGREA